LFRLALLQALRDLLPRTAHEKPPAAPTSGEVRAGLGVSAEYSPVGRPVVRGSVGVEGLSRHSRHDFPLAGRSESFLGPQPGVVWSTHSQELLSHARTLSLADEVVATGAGAD
jgi:hypothetical protein